MEASQESQVLLQLRFCSEMQILFSDSGCTNQDFTSGKALGRTPNVTMVTHKLS